ncbi:hypothetical protein H8D04_00435 [bacterium]|nr:hypothetical protein [bacterium]
MSTHPIKPITKPGEGTPRQKYMSHEVYLEERYLISAGLKGPKRLDKETYEDFVLRRKAENGLLKEYLRGVFMKDGKSTALDK